jgi:hypothetical protein
VGELDYKHHGRSDYEIQHCEPTGCECQARVDSVYLLGSDLIRGGDPIQGSVNCGSVGFMFLQHFDPALEGRQLGGVAVSQVVNITPQRADPFVQDKQQLAI